MKFVVGDNLNILLIIYLQLICHQFVGLNCISEESPQEHSEQNNAAMELINSVTGADDDGRSRQRVLTFAAKRYCLLNLFFLLVSLVGNSIIL